jgi:hypothetical protein
MQKKKKRGCAAAADLCCHCWQALTVKGLLLQRCGHEALLVESVMRPASAVAAASAGRAAFSSGSQVFVMVRSICLAVKGKRGGGFFSAGERPVERGALFWLR